MRVAATTAVVAGTAGAVSHHQQNRYAAKDQAAYDEQQAVAQSQQADAQAQQQAADMQAMQAQLDAMQAQQPAAAAAPAAAPGDDMMAQLTQLSQLKNAGVLDDAEFAAAKAKLLGI
jgi:hypothetical protein